MKYVTIKQIREEVLNKYLLLDTFVEYKKYHYPSGKAVFDVERGMVVKQVSNEYRLITNEDLVRWIKNAYSVKFLSIYKTPSQDTVYIEGFMPEFSFEDGHNRQFYVSFEIANSYSSRFLPVINLGIFYPSPPLNIKTSIRATRKTRVGLLQRSFNPDVINGLIEFAQDDGILPELIPILIDKLLYRLPAKLRDKAFELARTQSYRTLPISYLELCAKIASVWKLSAYELARTFQMQQHDYLIERMIHL